MSFEYRLRNNREQAVPSLPIGRIAALEQQVRELQADTSNGLINISNPDPIGEEGKLTINSLTNEMKVYYGGQWIVLHTLNVTNYFMLMETNDFLLLETGDKIIL